MRSSFLTINWRDIVKSIILAFIISILTGFYETLLQGNPLTWVTVKSSLLVALGTVLSYIVKNLLTNSRDQFLKTEPK